MKTTRRSSRTTAGARTPSSSDGWIVVRFTYAMLVNHPETVLATIRAALAIGQTTRPLTYRTSICREGVAARSAPPTRRIDVTDLRERTQTHPVPRPRRIVRRCLDDRTVKTRFSVVTGREEDTGSEHDPRRSGAEAIQRVHTLGPWGASSRW